MKMNFFLTGIFLCCSILAFAEPYGVCAHLNRMSEVEMRKELAGMAEAGIQTVRVDLDWSQVEPKIGEWDFSRWDKLVAEAEKRHIKVLAILGGELHKPVIVPYRNQDAFLRYVAACVKRYKGKIACYEVFNEADCGRPWGETPDPEHYAELLKKTYAVIKKNDPDAMVLFSGLSFIRNPFPFLEKALAAGAGKHCDALNFHPYQWKFVPEAQLRNKIVELRTLMKKYNVDKPIWITEIGNSSAPNESEFFRDAIAAGLEKLKIDPAVRTIGIIRDDDFFYYADGIHQPVTEYLPATAKHLRPLTFIEIASLDPKQCPVVFLPGLEGFPVRNFGFLRDYVKRGGTLIVAGGIPFYFNVEKQPNGMFSNAWLTKQCPAELHFGWEASWTRPGVPVNAKRLLPGADFPSLKKPRQIWTGRFLTSANLKGNDRMIPIYNASEGNYQAPAAALYMLDSDLKGNLILIPGLINETSTENLQAALLVRQALLLFSEGVSGFCYYRFRAGEWNRGREAHFGIVHRDFTPKPAYGAYKAFIRFRPSGSGPVTVINPRPGVYVASWVQPSGKRFCAVWSAEGKRELKFSGTPAAAFDLYGNPVKLPENVLIANPEPLYMECEAGRKLEFHIR